uniref:Ribose-phosphate pyrophosphokinase N-terminal domain-containing protein n=1 Tax=Oncorhynchus tshawytscha TaxID=74940 RepID=A0AAZ3RCW6_ONCTS
MVFCLTEVWQPRQGLATPPEGGAKTNVDKLKDQMVLFSANSSPSCMELANRIAERLGVELGKTEVYQDSNGETRIQIQESVRGKDVYIIQTISPDVNRCLMELCVMAYGCVTACARSVCGVLPYLPYSKQCKMRKRGSIVCKLIASLMCRAGETTRYVSIECVGDNGSSTLC